MPYAHRGEYDRAIQDYDQALRLDPNLAEAYHDRGRAYLYKGEYDRAIQDYDQALGSIPTLLRPTTTGAVPTCIKASVTAPFRTTTRPSGLPPTLPSPTSTGEMPYARNGEYDRAIQDYDQALGLDPNFAVTYIGQGLAHAEQGEYDRAIQDIRAYYNRETNYARFLRAHQRPHLLQTGVAYAEKASTTAPFNTSIRPSSLTPTLTLPTHPGEMSRRWTICAISPLPTQAGDGPTRAKASMTAPGATSTRHWRSATTGTRLRRVLEGLP